MEMMQDYGTTPMVFQGQEGTSSEQYYHATTQRQ